MEKHAEVTREEAPTGCHPEPRNYRARSSNRSACSLASRGWYPGAGAPGGDAEMREVPGRGEGVASTPKAGRAQAPSNPQDPAPLRPSSVAQGSPGARLSRSRPITPNPDRHGHSIFIRYGPGWERRTAIS